MYLALRLHLIWVDWVEFEVQSKSRAVIIIDKHLWQEVNQNNVAVAPSGNQTHWSSRCGSFSFSNFNKNKIYCSQLPSSVSRRQLFDFCGNAKHGAETEPFRGFDLAPWHWQVT